MTVFNQISYKSYMRTLVFALWSITLVCKDSGMGMLLVSVHAVHIMCCILNLQSCYSQPNMLSLVLGFTISIHDLLY